MIFSFGSCLILSRQSKLSICSALYAGPCVQAQPAADIKDGRPAQSYWGIQKPRGRPPAGSTKGAAYGFRIHTQRQQGHRAPPSAAGPLYKTGFRRYNRNAMRRAFGCDGGVHLRCRGRVLQHPVLHCTFLCACNQIIPLSAKLSSRRVTRPCSFCRSTPESRL